MGPKTEPCGTLDKTLQGRESWPFMVNLWRQLVIDYRGNLESTVVFDLEFRSNLACVATLDGKPYQRPY